MLWTLVGVVILNWSITLFGAASIFWPLAVLVVLAGFWGLVVAIISWLDLEDYPALARWENAFAWSNALLVVVLIGAWTYVQFHNAPGYRTDELSFDQYAAQLVAHGFHNPYTHSMQPAVPLFRLSPDGYTYTITGQPVEQLSYPSLSFLVYVPFMLLGWTSEVGAGVNVAAWALAVLLMFALLPRDMRAAALVLREHRRLPLVRRRRRHRHAVHPAADRRRVQVGPLRHEPEHLHSPGRRRSGDGDQTDAVAGARVRAVRDRLGRVRPHRRRRARPPVAPAGTSRVVLGVFLIPNLPYMIASPSAWFSGVLTPFVKNLVPSGQGLISLTLFAHLGGGSLCAYTVGLILAALLLLVVFVGTYPLLRPATFMLPSLAYFFAARSQTNYLIPLIPVALVGAVTAGPPAARRVLAVGQSRVAGVVRDAPLAPDGYRRHWRVPLVSPRSSTHSLRPRR